MIALTQSAMLLFACFAGVAPGSADEPAEKPSVKVEFRRAENKPAEGLVEATVPGRPEKIYLHKTADITNADIDEARSVVDDTGRSAIEIILTKEGGKKMEKLTEQHIDKPLAILFDGKVNSAPTVRQKISERILISGKFTKEEVDKIVKGIKGQ